MKPQTTLKALGFGMPQNEALTYREYLAARAEWTGVSTLPDFGLRLKPVKPYNPWRSMGLEPR